MRSIGKRNIKKVEALTIAEIKRQKVYPFSQVDYKQVDKRVIDALPADLWDTWEMADQEIRRIIDNITMNYAHGILKI